MTTNGHPDPAGPPGAGFSDTSVEADGFVIRYREAGAGDPLVWLHGGGGLRLSRTHDILAAGRRVIALEIPGFGVSPANDRSASLRDLAGTMNRAVAALGIEDFDLAGMSFGAKLAAWMAVLAPERVRSLVMCSPATIRMERPEGGNGPGEITDDLLYAHPERLFPVPPPSAETRAKQQALLGRLIGPPRDAELEAHLAELDVQALALFGTLDRVTPCDAAHLYREIMMSCHVVMIYDAAHAIDNDRPEAVASVIDDFLARHEQFLVSNQSGLLHP